MRAVLLAALVVAPAAAAAAPLKPPVVWKSTVKRAPPGSLAVTSVSHTLYLNDCQPGGCNVLPGFDDTLTHHSSIPIGNVTLSPYGHGTAHWNLLVDCVKQTFAPFQVEIVTTDPGPTVPHFEVMIGGRSTQLHPELDAGGVAPFIACGATENNVISFVFPETTTDLEYLCGAVAQEACHVWGLDHELDKDDPMTYLDLGSLKRFQNTDASCGESLAAPRACFCDGSTQNSYTYMADTFGPKTLEPAMLAITSPRDGGWVKPGFPVYAKLTSQLSPKAASLQIDGMPTQMLAGAPYAFNAPASLAGGDHGVTVQATDSAGRNVSASIQVHVTPACSAAAPCPDSFHCLGGFCLPGKTEAGGLGAACASNDQCITGSCGSSGDDMLCTGPCDAGESCPSGFRCLSSGSGGVCWPGGDDSGCTASSGPSPGLVLFGLGALLLVRRRRRA